MGEIKPVYGRWVWPYKAMQPGDYFIVDQALLGGEELRHRSGVRAAQLGIQLSITTHDPEHPGFTRVTRPDYENKPKERGKLLDYEQAGIKLMDWYGFNVDEIPAGDLYHKGAARIDTPQQVEPPVSRFMLDLPGSGRLGFLLDKEGFSIIGLQPKETMDSWLRKEPSLDDVMS